MMVSVALPLMNQFAGLLKSRPPEARRHGGGGNALDGRYAGVVSFESCIGAGLVDGVGEWG